MSNQPHNRRPLVTTPDQELSMATGMLEKCALHGLIPISTVPMADSMYGVVWESGLLMSKLWTVPHGGSGVMVWTGICYGQWTQLQGPFIRRHNIMHDTARPHVARICTQFLEAETVPVLHPWPAYSPDMSPTEHVMENSGSMCTTACSSSYQ